MTWELALRAVIKALVLPPGPSSADIVFVVDESNRPAWRQVQIVAQAMVGARKVKGASHEEIREAAALLEKIAIEWGTQRLVNLYNAWREMLVDILYRLGLDSVAALRGRDRRRDSGSGRRRGPGCGRVADA